MAEMPRWCEGCGKYKPWRHKHDPTLRARVLQRLKTAAEAVASYIDHLRGPTGSGRQAYLPCGVCGSSNPDLHECGTCGEKPGSPRLCEICLIKQKAAGKRWCGVWIPKESA